jgi:hypothetical protein
MTFASKFLDSNFPIGATLTGLRMPSDAWLQANGKAVLKSKYPLLSAIYKIGRLEGISRTLSAIPAVGQVESTPTNVSIPAISDLLFTVGAAGTSAVQYSNTSGVSWAPMTTPSITPSALLVTAGLFGISIYVLNSAAAQGAYTGSASSAPPYTMAATTGAPTGVVAGTSMSRLSYSPFNLGDIGGFGTIIALPSASGNAIYYATEGSGSFTSVTIGETSIKQACCLSNGKLLILKAGSANMLSVSVSGISGSMVVNSTNTVVLPEATASGQGNIACDHEGTVVVSGVPSGLLVSYDNGENFTVCSLPGITPADNWRIQRSGGYWLVPTAQGMLMSKDAKTWQLDTQTLQTFNVATSVAKAGSIIYQVVGASTAAFGLIESSTEFNLPNLRRLGWTPQYSSVPMEPTYIKAK